ncbi:four-carbon acid sugar kinase family protein [Streptomyces sp. QL37]|uniref:four-carbon acid sugar kinase family protein n=1 Tax=Streptomyces sp. QL37 TaxID=2093747 RepID=UPI000CF1D3D0|nr:four-carbon acid sugar kinase family protein [Streptomyces sp. QL37]PPQ55297.1 four-carbon acid sugar kinase family protein [Streptomyces sp. QL37]
MTGTPTSGGTPSDPDRTRRTGVPDPPEAPRVAFYGDDVTGSTDALAQFHRAGLRGVLHFGRDAAAAAAGRSGHDVVGVAGVARSLPTERMADEIRPALEALRQTGAGFVQYKMCSTADSSPVRGSLGRAAEAGREVFGAVPVPLLAAQPEFGRYTAFGHHFARDDDGRVHRLDRQPTMSRHPVTPMGESDLVLHLTGQTALPVASFDLTAYELPFHRARRRYDATTGDGPGIVVLDALTCEHARYAARLALTGGPSPLFALGSGGLSLAVGQLLNGTGTTEPYGAPGPGRVIVVSGSRAARTTAQIRRATEHGWATVPIPVDPSDGCDTSPAALAGLRDAVLRSLATDAPGVVVHALPAGHRDEPGTDPRDTLGDSLAHAVRTAVADGGVRRVVVVGGDTAGRVTDRLGARAAEIDTLLSPGAAMCRLTCDDPHVDGVSLLLKGGQAGPVDIFDRVAGRTGAIDLTTDPRGEPGT